MNSLSASVRRLAERFKPTRDFEHDPTLSRSADDPLSPEARPASPPRVFPTSGYRLVDSSVRLEEEGFPWYSPKKFYSVRLGEIFQGRYQVMTKLGFGTASTTWLCRDLEQHVYVTLKVYARGQAQMEREVAALNHIEQVITASLPLRHIGAQYTRQLQDEFRIGRGQGNRCLVYKPLALSIAEVRKSDDDQRLDLLTVKGIVFSLLQILDFLHRKANLVHADIQENNIMLQLNDESELLEIEERELQTDPAPRKVYPDRTIYASRLMAVSPGMPVLCDFGEARFGKDEYAEDILPDLYRAPEILFRLAWTSKVDIWTLGLVMWTMLEGTNLLTNNKGGRQKSARPHMARIISLLGPPPPDMADGSRETKKYFHKNGRLKGGHAVEDTSLEKEAKALVGDEKAAFLRFLRRMLQWDPEDRPSARELLKDPYLIPPKDTSPGEVPAKEA